MSMRPLGSSVDLPIPLDSASGLPTLLYPCDVSPPPEDRAEAPLCNVETVDGTAVHVMAL